MGLFRKKVEIISPTVASTPIGPGYVASSAPSSVPSAPAAPLATPASPSAGAFSLTIQDVFSITGRGTVVTGKIDAGEVRVGDQVRIRTAHGELTSTISGIEAFRKVLKQAQAGDNVGLLLSGIGRGEVARGDVITH